MDFLAESQAKIYRSPGGTLSLWRPAPGVLVSRVVGTLTREGAKALEDTFKQVIAEDGRQIGFHDWSEMTDYDMASRLHLTAEVGRNMRHVEGVHFFSRSRIVVFGLQAAKLVLRDAITIHDSRESIERALAARLRGKAA